MSREKISTTVCIFILVACSKTDTPRTQSVALPADASLPKKIVQNNEQKYNGPFGLKAGLTPAQVEEVVGTLKPDGESLNWSNTLTVPVPHSDFESYSLHFSETSGLCAIIAVGKDIQSGRTGSEIRSRFDALDNALTSKYGTGENYSSSSDRDGSPEFWMLHMLQKNRKLVKIWDKKSKVLLDNNIRGIVLQANVGAIDSGYVNVRYEFDNFSDCSREDKNRKNKGL